MPSDTSEGPLGDRGVLMLLGSEVGQEDDRPAY
jgi:hypothetical protein